MELHYYLVKDKNFSGIYVSEIEINKYIYISKSIPVRI